MHKSVWFGKGFVCQSVTFFAVPLMGRLLSFTIMFIAFYSLIENAVFGFQPFPAMWMILLLSLIPFCFRYEIAVAQIKGTVLIALKFLGVSLSVRSVEISKEIKVVEMGGSKRVIMGQDCLLDSVSTKTCQHLVSHLEDLLL